MNEADNADTEGHRVDVAADPTSHPPATASNDDAGAGVGKHVGEEQTSQPSAEVCTEETVATVVLASLLITCTATGAVSDATGVLLERDTVVDQRSLPLIPLPVRIVDLADDTDSPNDYHRRLVTAVPETREAIDHWAESEGIQLGDYEVVHLANHIVSTEKGMGSAPILRIVGLATVPAPSKPAGKRHEWCDKPNRRFKQGWVETASVYTLSLERFSGDLDVLNAFSACYLSGREPVGLCDHRKRIKSRSLAQKWLQGSYP